MTTSVSPTDTLSTSKFQTLNNEVRRALAVHAEQPERDDIWQELLKLRRSVAEVIAGLSSSQKSGAMVETAFMLLHAFEESGMADQPATREDLALAGQYRRRNWPGLVASMILVPAWQSPEAPLMDDVQPWLWAEYTRWMFYTPKGFAAVGQPQAYAAHYLKRLEELAAWGARNRGAAAVRVALQVYRLCGSCLPLYFDTGSLRRHYELRAKILAIGIGIGPQEDMLPVAREGRRLRIGFINRHFGPQTETYCTLPTFEQMDPERFEVILFTHTVTGSALENYARSHSSDFRLLTGDVTAQVEILRNAALDIAVFGTNVTAVFNEVAALALHRVAPLQVVNNSSCTTSGMPECDVYVSGELTEIATAHEHFSERLALIPGPTHAFNYEADRLEASTEWTRAALGIPEDVPVFVSGANYFKIIPEMQHAWARLLAAVPNARLLVHPFNPNWSSNYPVKRLCAEFDRVLAQHGVGSERLVVSTMKFPSRLDVKELLSVGDVYLDTYPFGGVNSLVDPLQSGIPSIAWEGTTFRSRMGAAMLRSMQLDELVVSDEESYHKLAVRLATDLTLRHSLRDRIKEIMSRTPIYLDQLASSEALGALLETAYDELVEKGREVFRREHTPIVCAKVANPDEMLAEGKAHLEAGLLPQALACAGRVLGCNPASVEARHLMGLVLLKQGRNERAVNYLVAAVQQAGRNPALWFDLTTALRSNGQYQEALQALETCLRIDEKNVDAWLLVLDIAEQLNHTDMIQEALKTLKQIAPDDPRVVSKMAMAGML